MKKILCSIAALASFSGAAQAATYVFDVNYSGGNNAALASGSDNPLGVTLSAGDSYTYSLSATGAGEWTTLSSGSIFPFFSLYGPFNSSVADISLTLSNNGISVLNFAEAGIAIRNAGPVKEIGFFMNYAPGVGDPATISALDINGNVFASYDLTALAPISTPGGFNAFEFRGIRSDQTDIYGLRFGGSYILLTGTANGVPIGVPEPAAWAMMLAGFGLVGSALRRRSKVAVTFA